MLEIWHGLGIHFDLHEGVAEDSCIPDLGSQVSRFRGDLNSGPHVLARGLEIAVVESVDAELGKRAVLPLAISEFCRKLANLLPILVRPVGIKLLVDIALHDKAE